MERNTPGTLARGPLDTIFHSPYYSEGELFASQGVGKSMVTNSPALRAAQAAAPDELASLIAQLEAVVPRYIQTLRRAIEEVEGRDSLTLPQYRCLQAVAARGCTLTTHLARQFQVGVPTMTGRLDALVDRGLIQRRPDPASRRQVLVTITAQGQELLDRYRALVDAELRDLLAPLAPEQHARLRDALGDLAAALAAAPERTSQPPCARENEG